MKRFGAGTIGALSAIGGMLILSHSVSSRAKDRRRPDGSSSPGYNWRCRLGFHQWHCWSAIDRERGYAFAFMKCTRPRCKWAGLTWSMTERVPK